MTYTRALVVLWLELGAIAATGWTLYTFGSVASGERNLEHAERIERELVPAYLTERER